MFATEVPTFDVRTTYIRPRWIPHRIQKWDLFIRFEKSWKRGGKAHHLVYQLLLTFYSIFCAFPFVDAIQMALFRFYPLAFVNLLSLLAHSNFECCKFATAEHSSYSGAAVIPFYLFYSTSSAVAFCRVYAVLALRSSSILFNILSIRKYSIEFAAKRETTQNMCCVMFIVSHGRLCA